MAIGSVVSPEGTPDLSKIFAGSLRDLESIKKGIANTKKSLGNMDELSSVISGLEDKLKAGSTFQDAKKTVINAGILSKEQIANTMKKAKIPPTIKPTFKQMGLKGLLKSLAKSPKFWFIAGLAGLAAYVATNNIYNKDGETITVGGLLLRPLFIPKDSARSAEEKFDWDKNGELDEDEKTALELYKKSMERQKEEKEKADLLKRFDVNKDGKIDDVERTSMEAYHIEQNK